MYPFVPLASLVLLGDCIGVEFDPSRAVYCVKKVATGISA